MRATTPQFRDGADAWLSGYYKHGATRRAGACGGGHRRAFERRPMTDADVLTTSALLHAIGAASQKTRAGWHDARALAAARWALERDPTQLDALQGMEWRSWEHRPRSTACDPLCRAGNRTGWRGWSWPGRRAPAIASAGARARSRTTGRGTGGRAGARGGADPDDPRCCSPGRAMRWNSAAGRKRGGSTSRGCASRPTSPGSRPVTSPAMTRDGRCGAMARDMNEHIKAAGPKPTCDPRRPHAGRVRCHTHNRADLEANP